MNFAMCLLVFVTLPSMFSANQCPSLLENEKKYKIFSDKDTWSGALQSCTSKGMKFAMIMNNSEYTHVLQLIACYVSAGWLPPASSAPHYIWIGASDIRTRGSYLWASTGKFATFFSWKAGEPNHARENENCVFLEGSSHNNMNDAPCDYPFYYMCQQ